MSMFSEQVKELREYAEYLDWVGAEKVMKALITQAADTIEALSEKPAAANMERSERCYGKEKKLIEELAEEIENCYGRETELSERARDYLLKTDYGGGWIACEDRLPTKGGSFLVQSDSGEIFSCEFDSITDGYNSPFWCCNEKIVAWQPLPEPYRP